MEGNIIYEVKVFNVLYFFAGISMHKGFAFVQFTGPFDARSACLGEDDYRA